MALLSLQNVGMEFSERTLFSGISLEVGERDKIGFIGANGIGKTTLFKIICGELEPTSGGVAVSKAAKVGYMEQHACKHPENTVYNELLSVFQPIMDIEEELDALHRRIEIGSGNLQELTERQMNLREQLERDGGLTYKSRTAATLNGLGFGNEYFDMPIKKLSGGQLSKLSLAKLLLSGAKLLLLDEPTNHLDIASCRWLEGFIRDFGGAVIVISHDRYFLDSVTNRTIELEHGKIKSYKGSYSEFMKKKEAAQEAIRNKYAADMKEIKRIEGIVEQQKRWGRERNFITAASKQKQADRIKEQLEIPESELETIHFRFTPKEESGNDVLKCEGLSKSFGEKQIFENVNLHIRKGERIFLLGANGCGKTTLFKTLLGQYPASSGFATFGANVRVGYFDQIQENLHFENTALDEVWNDYPHMTQTQVRTALGSFLFKGDDVFKEIKNLSGGERARIALLKLMLDGGNFLLLDEPTNHLDTASREALEKTLLDYSGTMLIISHDRYFINRLATRIITLQKNGTKEYIGNYDDYLEKSDEESGVVSSKSKKEPTAAAMDYKAKKEYASNKRKLQTAVKRCEEEIARLEQDSESVQAKLSDPECASDFELLTELTGKLEELNTRSIEMMEEWEQLNTRLETEFAD
ncbi:MULTISPECIES: ABC-F family ATP-binding cassette domain-containing protein [unclassified Ruminococcus]|uniref:ABC-F family ATP-binding cassette domain-containing protein n=1 Tax=unclassified Ruminococcus TaxID=2608920 RepID=UPI00210EDCD8|nr:MULTISPECIES: ABC-F family ATP-binding cassette domain-containing protein [unclassified Ruminococcus]MCQ4023034.1 ATP-binding cassette domain-containing protein [Ruminococcus sp. zg-924]MCQ4115471.1 ATP-binding cassette domain-containing protein [Ruminococcus sp. zg-921]